MSRLVVYIPSWNNYSGAAEQVERLGRQRLALHETPWDRVFIVVADNGSSYDATSLKALGADEVISRPVNIGGDLNIALGFLEARTPDFLWILSDNDAVQDGALERLSAAFRDDVVDLVVGAESIDEAISLVGLPDPSALGYRLHLGLISGVVYRYRAFEEFAPVGIRLSWTGWGQLAIQEAASHAGAVGTTLVLPLTSLVSVTRGDSSSRSIERARAAYAHSYFGSGALAYLMAESQRAGKGRRALSRWWSSQWIYASAYRVGSEDPGIFLTAYPSQAAVRHLVEALVRTGGAKDRLLFAASFLPYWRVGLALRNRGIRLRRWY